MATKIFVNLPVKDLKKAMDFFGKIGYSFNPQFTNDDAACMVISEDIFAMLLTHKHFQGFIKKDINDSSKTTEAIIALSADSRQKVDEICDIALANGGTEVKEPADHGFMYIRTFEDLDGHHWEYLWMDPAALK